MNFTSPLPLPLRYLRKRSKSARTVGTERTERTDGTQDSALYTCGCGYVFKARAGLCSSAWQFAHRRMHVRSSRSSSGALRFDSARRSRLNRLVAVVV